MSPSSKRHATVYWTGFGIIIALLIVAPLVLPEFWRRFLTEILIWGLLAMSSDILIGYTGMVSFGHSAFFGLGMYGAAAALLMVKPPNLWLAILYGLALSAGAALFVAYFATRLRDIYFAISTLIFSQIFYVAIFTLTRSQGENGLNFSRPQLGIPGFHDTVHSSLPGSCCCRDGVLSHPAPHHPVAVRHGAAVDRENEPRTRAIGIRWRVTRSWR
jgi:branched-chain amino acid transport system permease protein